MNENQPQPTPRSRKSWPRRHKGWAALIVVAALIAVGTAANAATGNGHKAGGMAAVTAPASTRAATPQTSVSPLPITSPQPALTSHTKVRIIFRVWGSAPAGADIMYGTDSDNRSPAGGLGFDGSGSAVPWTGSVRYHASALYYDISAQLQGGGNINCAVVARVTKYWSDGTHISRSKVLARGHASGSYNICDAQTS